MLNVLFRLLPNDEYPQICIGDKISDFWTGFRLPTANPRMNIGFLREVRQWARESIISLCMEYWVLRMAQSYSYSCAFFLSSLSACSARWFEVQGKVAHVLPWKHSTRWMGLCSANAIMVWYAPRYICEDTSGNDSSPHWKRKHIVMLHLFLHVLVSKSTSYRRFRGVVIFSFSVCWY